MTKPKTYRLEIELDNGEKFQALSMMKLEPDYKKCRIETADGRTLTVSMSQIVGHTVTEIKE